MEAWPSVVERLCAGARLVEHVALKGGVSATVTSVVYEKPDGSRVRVVVRRHEGSDRNVRTEYELMTILGRLGLPVPQPIVWLDGVFATPALVLPFVEGERSPRASEHRIRQMARTLADLHALRTELPPLPPRDANTDILEFLPATGYDALRHRAPRLRPRPAVLCHGDYWWGNLLWQGDQIAAVLDWEDAALGDPLSDLAGARLELLWSSGQSAVDVFTAHYLTHNPTDIDDLPLWEIYVASAAARFMPQWGLPSEMLERQLALAQWFVDRASNQILAR